MKKFFQEFKEFAMRGNVLDMAVGVVVGSAFTAIVTSIVQNLLTPLLGLLIPDSTFAEWAPGGFGIGAVINSIISFIITAFVVFLLVKGVKQADAPEEAGGAGPGARGACRPHHRGAADGDPGPAEGAEVSWRTF